MSWVSAKVTIDESLGLNGVRVCLEVAITSVITEVDWLVVFPQDVPHLATDAPERSLHLVPDIVGRIIKVKILLRGSRKTRR